MVQNSIKQTPPLPGIIACITSGFELTIRHPWLIMFPVVLDIFFWLGPRLNITHLVSEATSILTSEPAYSRLVEEMLDLAPQINLFTSLSVPVIGVPALMGGLIPEVVPVTPANIEISGAFSWLLIMFLLSLIGLGLTSLYLGSISLELKREQGEGAFQLQMFLRRVMIAYFRLIGLALAFTMLLLILAIAMLPVAFILMSINSILLYGLFFFIFFFIVAYLSLSVPGIVYNGRPLIRAIIESLRLVFRNMLPTLNLFFFVILINFGTNILWHRFDNGSWLTLALIFGHGFINTALAAAIIVFYRDRYSYFFDSKQAVS